MKRRGLFLTLACLMSFCELSSCSNGEEKTSISSSKPVEYCLVDSAASLIASSAINYGYSGNKDDLITSSNQSKGDNLTASGMSNMLMKAFSSSMPSKTGARRTMGTSYSIDEVADVKSTCKCYDAVSFLAQYGLLTLDENNYFYPSQAVGADDVKIYLDRFYSYYGTRPQDDYYSYINHDYLFLDPRWADKTKPLIDSDDDGVDDEEYVYDSKIIPSSGIYKWSRRIANESPNSDVAQFLETYYDQTHRVDGDLCGLYALGKSLVSASSMAEIENLLKQEYITSGYFPLWRKLSIDLRSDEIWAKASNFAISGSIEVIGKGTSKYAETVATFKENFKAMYLLSDEQASDLATDYADFKCEYISKREGYSKKEGSSFSPKKDEYFGVDGDSEHIDNTGFDLYSFILSGGIDDPEYIRWGNYATIMPLLDMWNEDDFRLFRAYLAYELGNQFWFCLPEKNVAGWFKDDSDVGTTIEKLDRNGSYSSGAYPFIHDDVIELYYGRQEYLDCVSSATNMVTSLKEELRQMISAKSWLGETSKSYCYDKLDKLSYSIGVSCHYKGEDKRVGKLILTDFKGKQESGTLFVNIRLCFDSIRDFFASNLGKECEEEDFFAYVYDYDPLTANAFYSPSYNTINITLGYMTSMDPITSMSEEEILANYGWVIGHEISHGFDPSGINFDAEGEYGKSPFTDEEKASYEQKASSIASFYDGYEVMPGEATDGTVTLTEDVADVTGVRMSLNIAKKNSNFDYGKFFSTAADKWGCIITRYIYDSYGYRTDVHPYGRARLNRCFSCFDEFHDALSTKEGDGMYVAKEDRVGLW